MTSRFTANAILLALLLGCGKKTPPAAPAPSVSTETATTHPIQASVGGVAGPADGAQITLPPGALPRDATLRIAKSPPNAYASPGVSVIGPVWNFQVDGGEHFTFSKPVTIAVPFDPALRDPGSTVGLSVWDGERWDRVPGAKLDPASARITARVTHFSDYAPIQDAPPKPPPVPNAGYLKNAYWYGLIRISIHGEGAKHDPFGGVESYQISRDASVSFRLRAVPGELAMDSLFQELKKKHPEIPLPVQAAKGLESAQAVRHWITDTVKPTSEDRTQVHLSVKDRYSANHPEVKLGELQEDSGSSLQTLTGTWDESPLSGHSLEIDVRKGTYSFSLGDLAGGLLKFHRTSTGQPPEDKENPTGVAFRLKDQKLPGEGGLLTGSVRTGKDPLNHHPIAGIQGSWSFNYGHALGLITWTFSPTPLEDVSLVLSLPGYEDWMPRGGTTPGQKGNALPIQARLQHRGGGAAQSARMTRLTVRLKQCSNEPGVCLNVPLDGGDDTFDLQFAPGDSYTLMDKGTLVLKKGTEFDRLDLHLDCYDWGAYGTLVAEAELKDGRMLWATLETDPSIEEILVPKRSPGSKIADKWKKEMNAEGMNDKDDHEGQTGNRNDGDGLTLYEEYRGLIAKGKHTRDYPAGPDGFRPLSPRRKDLIVCNTIQGEPAVVAGFHLLEKAAGIHVVEVDERELPTSRVVNINRSNDTSVGFQHGLKLFNVPLPKGTTGDTPRDYNKPAGSRERYDRVQVDLAQIRGFHHPGSPDTWSADAEIAETVAHELGHGLDLDHHGEASNIQELRNTSRMHLYDDRHQPLKNVVVNGRVGEPGNEASGDVHCIMCYNDVYTWGYHATEFLFERVITPPGTIFCTSRDGTGHNADFEIDDPDKPGHPMKVPGVFGKAAAGPCLPKMRIKDPAN